VGLTVYVRDVTSLYLRKEEELGKKKRIIENRFSKKITIYFLI